VTPEQDAAVVALANPALAINTGEVEAIARDFGLTDDILFRTSGTSDVPKWVALSREALDASARAVNEHLGASSNDVWLRALPEFHVGGYSIGIRARLAGGRVEALAAGSWDAATFAGACRNCGATLSALVPTQIYDLVAAELVAPGDLRAVLVGGGVLAKDLKQKAASLGWRLFETYGMTEAASQVATEGTERDGMHLLAHWEARTARGGELEIRGSALFTAYLRNEAGAWQVDQPFDTDGWFATGDRIGLDSRKLVFEGRMDAEVKVLGERVDLDALQARLELLAGTGFAVLAVPDDRSGNRLLLIAEGGGGDAVLAAFNDEVAGFERLTQILSVAKIPRSALGKVLRPALEDQIAENTSEA